MEPLKVSPQKGDKSPPAPKLIWTLLMGAAFLRLLLPLGLVY